MPLHRRLPKRGFSNLFRKEYTIVNLEALAAFETGAEVTPQSLKERGIIRNLKHSLKVLGTGDLPHALKVCAHKFSKSAVEKIQKAGGSIEILSQ